MHRADLQRVLLAAVDKAGVTIAYGTTVAELLPRDDGVHVRLTDGRVVTYALVLGFDGINSALRRHVTDAAGARPRQTGYATWRVAAPHTAPDRARSPHPRSAVAPCSWVSATKRG